MQHFAFQLWSDIKHIAQIDRLCAKSLDKTMHNEKSEQKQNITKNVEMNVNI